MIPYNRPFIGGKELSNIAQAVIKYGHISGDGVFTKRCQAWLQETLGCPRALLTHSCTAALEMAAILCDIQPGDEVIMPSYTFVSTANAFVLRGGVPVFVDIRPDTLNMDETRIEEAITPRTKAIVPVHYAGVPCAMDEINAIAKEHKLFVIEDAAQALLSKYKDRFLGTLGHMGTLSFHETKNIISGEGGALLLNDERFSERAEILWEKGTNRKKFFRGEVDKYTWVDVGSSFLPSEIIAAFLHAQLEMTETIINARCRLFDLYYSLLEPLARKEKIGLPWVENALDRTCPSNGHIFYIVTASLEERSALIAYLKGNGIHAVFHYIPLHSSPAGKRFGRTSGDLNFTTDLSDRVLRLPLFYEMAEEEVHGVVDRINEFYEKSDSGVS
jgi:dTDP-4-amino-4,6-dideoxygalactose transaminase